jgi:hypothetical protein
MTIVIGGSSPSVTFPDSTVQNTAGLPLTGGTLSGPVTVPTLNAPSGVLATQNGMTGIAKAWVNFNGGQGNTAGVINNSFNVSSITVNGTGDYTANFTTAMPNANYCTVSNVKYITNAGASLVFGSSLANFAGNPATTSVRILCGYGNNSNVYNMELVNIAVLGS